MMNEIFIICGLVLGLYFKTYKYKNLIDDPVPRDGYLYEGPRKVSPSFYETRRPLLATITNIAVFMVSSLYIYLLWGFKAAVLFAVFPLNVFSAAWTTGNYYASTVLLILASHYHLLMGNIFGTVLAMVFYGAALNSTVNALSYCFIAPLFVPGGFYLTFPMVFFLLGKRFKTGIKLRKKMHDNLNVNHSFSWENFRHVPMVFSHYIYTSLRLNKLGFFSDFDKGEHQKNAKFFLSSIVLCASFFILVFNIDRNMALWWFLSLGIFTHIQGHMGQYVTERYTALANVAFCVMLSMVLPTNLFIIVATVYFLVSYRYVTAYKCNTDLYAQGMYTNPLAAENYGNLAQWYLERKDYRRAVEPLVMAEKLSRGYKYPIYVNLAKCLLNEKMFEQALHYLKMAILVCPNSDKESLQREVGIIEGKLSKSQKLAKQWSEL
jgi:tetratricopeptide (TPR) repeat protein